MLLSSIFFMADSVVRGYLTTAKLSSLGGRGALHTQRRSQHVLIQCILGNHSATADLRSHLHLGYLGARVCLRVLGLWKVVLYLGFLCFLWMPFFTALRAF